MDGHGSVLGKAGSVTAQWISHWYSTTLVLSGPTLDSIYLFNSFKNLSTRSENISYCFNVR